MQQWFYIHKANQQQYDSLLILQQWFRRDSDTRIGGLLTGTDIMTELSTKRPAPIIKEVVIIYSRNLYKMKLVLFAR